jgi:surface antigen
VKQRSTTPVSKSFATRACIIAATILTLTLSPLAITPVAKADRYDDQIRAIQSQIDSFNAQASALSQQADSYARELGNLNNQKAQIQAQLDLSVAKASQLADQIKQNEKKIEDNKSLLGKTIADLYIDDKISPLEMLASSKSIADYVDKQSNREQIQQSVQSTIKEIKELKKKLEEQKKAVDVEVANQQNARAALAAKESEVATLMAQVQGQENAYRNLSAQSEKQKNDVRQQQQSAIAARFSRSGGASLVQGGAAGGYPWNSSNCSMSGYYSLGGADGNGGDGKGYGCRQCASYAAWRVASETGMYPVYWGNATNFPSSARSAGFQTGYSPRAGSLAVMHAAKSGGPEGHVGWVEEVLPGGRLLISQYNYNYGAGYGMYSKMEMSASAWDEYVYIK